MRLTDTEQSFGSSLNDIIWVEYDVLTIAVKGSVVTLYGEIQGSMIYTS
ncbi:hypothetical protein ACE1TI_07560 [Alteribacillus sp. JSM 102045]